MSRTAGSSSLLPTHLGKGGGGAGRARGGPHTPTPSKSKGKKTSFLRSTLEFIFFLGWVFCTGIAGYFVGHAPSTEVCPPPPPPDALTLLKGDAPPVPPILTFAAPAVPPEPTVMA